MTKEFCVLCNKETTTDVLTHVDFRVGYIEGVGQLCTECYIKGGSSNREHIIIPKEWLSLYPNNYDLGEKVRNYFWSEYENIKSPK